MAFPGDRRTVLIIGKDARSREALAQILQILGYRAFQVENVRQAIDYLDLNPPNLVLLNRDMPIAAEEEFLSRLRCLAVGARPALVVVNGPGRKLCSWRCRRVA